MHTGTLRHTITIETQHTATNEYGESTVTWQPKYSAIRAEFRANKGDQWLNDGQLVNTQTHTFTLRHRPGISQSDRLIFKGQIYDIQSVLPDNKFWYLQIKATEGQSNG